MNTTILTIQCQTYSGYHEFFGSIRTQPGKIATFCPSQPSTAKAFPDLILDGSEQLVLQRRLDLIDWHQGNAQCSKYLVAVYAAKLPIVAPK